MDTQAGAQAPQPRAPGIMLVRSTITDPTFTATQYQNWTRLHFEDLLKIPPDPRKGRIPYTFRFTAPSTNPSTDQQKYPYFNTIHLDDISILYDKPYLETTRQLDIENTREDGKINFEAVGRKGQIFDVVDAKFAVFTLEDTSNDDLSIPHSNRGPNPFNVEISNAAGKHPVEDGFLVAIGVTEGKNSLTSSIYEKKKELCERLGGAGGSADITESDVSVFRYDRDAQPPLHPEIENVEEYLLLSFLPGVRKEDGIAVGKEVEKLAEEWRMKLGDRSKVTSAVWKGETGMGG